MKAILDLIARHKSGEPCGMVSVCSAHPLVIEATLLHVLRHRRAVRADRGDLEPGQSGRRLYRHEAGGLPRLRPSHCDRVGLPRERIVLGGDHLGPNAWQAQPAEAAMARADVLIEDYVRAGFRKIHLDCSMSCADDPAPLSDADDRAARGAPLRASPSAPIARRRRAAGLCHRHRGSGSRRCRGRARHARGHDARRRRARPSTCIADLRRRRPRRRLAARDRRRGPARRRIRSSQGRRLCARKGARAQPR